MTWPFAAGLDRAFRASQIALEHDPEKAKPAFFEKHALGPDPRDHAQTKRWGGMTIRRKVIWLWRHRAPAWKLCSSPARHFAAATFQVKKTSSGRMSRWPL
jgi:hypothetical protein